MVTVGESTAPLNIFVYSDPRCQYCRVHERNNHESFQHLVDEGILQIHYVDIPQSQESVFHISALLCEVQENNDLNEFQTLRNNIFTRANLSKAYTKRELERLGVIYDKDCDDGALRDLLKERKQKALLCF